MLSPRRHLSVDELSHRSSTGLALRRGEVKISEPIPFSYVHNGLEMDGQYGVSQQTERVTQNETWPRRSTATTMTGRSDGSAPVIHDPTDNETFGMTRNTATKTSAKSVAAMQRRNTGLKASLKRMFSSKRDNHDGIEGRRAQQAPTASMSRPKKDLSPLQQHPYIEAAFANLASISHHDLPAHSRPHTISSSPLDSMKRRNTIPEVFTILNDTHVTNQDLVLRPIAHEIDNTVDGGNVCEDKVGRRSRSAGALTELLKSPPARIRPEDRAEKIVEWRESIASISKPKLKNKTSDLGVQAAVNDSISRRASLEQTKNPPRPSIEPVQDFDFGLTRLKIAPQHGTVEERMNTLEVKMADFEYAIVKLQGSDFQRPSIPRLEPAAKSRIRPPLQGGRHSECEDRMPSLSSSCSTKDFSFTSSPRDGRRKLSEKEEAEQASVIRAAVRAQHARKPSSIRSRNPSPTLAIPDNRQYKDLLKMIQDERQARSELEVRLAAMQKQLDDLSTPIPVYIKPVNQLTPSPDINVHRPLHRSPALRPQYHFQNETSRFSMNETETEAGDTEDGYEQQFMTPQADAYRFEHMDRAPIGMI